MVQKEALKIANTVESQYFPLQMYSSVNVQQEFNCKENLQLQASFEILLQKECSFCWFQNVTVISKT